MSEEQKEFVKIEIGGKDEHLWQKLRVKFGEVISSILDTIIDDTTNSTLRDEAKKFTSALLDYGKSKLNKPGIDNEKTLAEIDLLYTQKQKTIAETRKIHAEANNIELSNKIKSIKVALTAYKLVLLKETGSQEIVFVKDIDEFINTLKLIEEQYE